MAKTSQLEKHVLLKETQRNSIQGSDHTLSLTQTNNYRKEDKSEISVNKDTTREQTVFEDASSYANIVLDNPASNVLKHDICDSNDDLQRILSQGSGNRRSVEQIVNAMEKLSPANTPQASKLRVYLKTSSNEDLSPLVQNSAIGNMNVPGQYQYKRGPLAFEPEKLQPIEGQTQQDWEDEMKLQDGENVSTWNRVQNKQGKRRIIKDYSYEAEESTYESNVETEEEVDDEVTLTVRNAEIRQQQEDDVAAEKLIESYKTRLQHNDNTVIFDLFEMLLEKMSQVQKGTKQRRTYYEIK